MSTQCNAQPPMTEEIEIGVMSPEETLAVGEAMGRTLPPGSIVALCGELGAGKTVLTKGIARGLDVKEEPVSPTFVILAVYEGRLPLYHFDLYRLEGAGDLEGIGYEEYFFGKGVTVVEWAERAGDIYPPYTIHIEIEMPSVEGVNQGIITQRTIKIRGDKGWLSSFRSMAEQALQTLRR